MAGEGLRAVVLAAGEGVRMVPLTHSISKMLLPIAGRPLLEHVLTALKEAGVTAVTLIVGHRKQDIINHFGGGKALGMQLSYVEQPKQKGTAHALSFANLKEGFVAVNGDVLFDAASLREMIDVHKRTGAAATLGAYRVDDITAYGALVTDGKKVLKVVEKPKKGETNLANAGVYVFSPLIFAGIDKTRPSKRGELEITSSIQGLIDEGRFIQVHELKRWQHVGVPWDLLSANEFVLQKQDRRIKGMVEPGAVIRDNVWVGEGTRVRSGAYVEGPVRIGKNCDVGPNCFIRPFTTLGDRVRIGNGVEVKNCIVMDGTHIGHLTYVGDSVIGRNCNFGAGTKVGNLRLDEKNVKMEVKGKLVDTGRRKLGAIIADGVKTGLNSVVNPGLKLGPNSALGPGAVLYEDLAPNKCVLVKQQLEETTRK